MWITVVLLPFYHYIRFYYGIRAEGCEKNKQSEDLSTLKSMEKLNWQSLIAKISLTNIR